MSFAISAATHVASQMFSQLSESSASPLQALSPVSSLLDKIALNPQPLPPKEGGGSSGHARYADEYCGTVPRIPPHIPGPWGELAGAAMAFR